MRFFIDTARLDEIEQMSAYGIVDGVTTGLSDIAKQGKDLKETLIKMCQLTDGPVSAGVPAEDTKTMVREGVKIAGWHENMVVKIPMTMDGIRAVNALSARGIKTNVTMVYDCAQALIAAKAGASYVSPVVGGADEVRMAGLGELSFIAQIYGMYGLCTQIIAVNMPTPAHVTGAAKAGVDIAAVPYECMKKMFLNPMTDMSLGDSIKDWRQAIIGIRGSSEPGKADEVWPYNG